eukprot:g6001.t1
MASLVSNENNTTTITTTTTSDNNINSIRPFINALNDHLSNLTHQAKKQALERIEAIVHFEKVKLDKNVHNELPHFEDLEAIFDVCSGTTTNPGVISYIEDDILAMVNMFAKTSTKFLKHKPLYRKYFTIVLAKKYAVFFRRESVDLRNKNLTDEDALAIGEMLKTNNTLKTLCLSYNNITDVQSIGEGLKTNNTLRRLSLYNNQLSRNVRSQLGRIEQYKRDGSNGYQYVKGMRIYR